MAIDLSSLSRGRRLRAPISIFYGPEGCGKTTFGAGAPKPILARAEDGIGALATPRWPADVEDGGTGTFQTFEEVCEFLAALLTDPHDYQSLVFDSLSALEKLIWAYVCRQHNVDSIEEVLKGYGKGYTEAVYAWQTFYGWLEALRNQRGMAIVLIGHSTVQKFTDPQSSEYDQYALRLHKKAAEYLFEKMDIVGFLNWRTFTEKEEQGFNKTRVRATNQRRVLYLSKQPAFYAKQRENLPNELQIQDDPTNPTCGWQVFIDAWNAATTSPAAAE